MTDSPDEEILRFGLFELDVKAGQLRKGGMRLRLAQQPVQLLMMLLERPGEVVTRDQLRQRLWPQDVFVDFDHGLNKCVQKLRDAIGDSAESPRYIETIPRVGYRFIAPVNGGARIVTREPANVSVLNGDQVDAAPADPQNQNSANFPGRSRGKLLWSLLAVCAFLLAIMGVNWVHRRQQRQDAPIHSHRKWIAAPASTSAVKAGLSRAHSIPLTMVAGLVDDPAFSPDGEKIAFFWDAEGNARTDLYVQLVGGEKPLRLTHIADGFLCCASWSPNGLEIAFFRCDDNGGGIYSIPTLGGSERKLTDATCLYGRDGYPEWTPDGNSLLIADRCAPNSARGIVLFSLTTGERRCLTSPPPPADTGDGAPKLSPDGLTVAFLRSTTLDLSEIYTVDISGRNLQQLTDDGATIDRFMWSPDGKYIIFDSRRKGSGHPWRVSAAGGSIEQEEEYPGVGSLSRDGRRLAFVGYSGLPGTIWRVRLAGPIEKRKPPSLERIVASSCGNDSPQLSPNQQKLVFRSCRSGNPELWVSDANGENPRRLTFTSAGWLGSPRWSPDGKRIAFDYRVEGHSQIQMIDSDGRNRRPVTTGGFDSEVPTWARDGASIYFTSNRSGSWQVWKRQIATGRETQVTRNGGIAVYETPSANMLYYSKIDAAGIWSRPEGGGNEQLVTRALHRGYWGYFSVTDDGIYLLDSDAVPRPMIMFYSFQARRLIPVLRLPQQPDPWSPDLAASSDGRTLFFSQNVPQNSITMVENLP